MILSAIGAIAGLGTSIYGAVSKSRAAKKQEKLLAEEKANQNRMNEEWYNRNYYQDYLNSVEAQNAMKKYRDEWAKRTREERARQVISGGTPEQAQAVAEAGGKAMGDLVGNLAAQGQRNKQEVDAQKLRMDSAVSSDYAKAMGNIASQEQAAGAKLMSAGIDVMSNSLEGMEQPKKEPTPDLDTVDGPVYKDTSIKLPKNVEPYKPLI